MSVLSQGSELTFLVGSATDPSIQAHKQKFRGNERDANEIINKLVPLVSKHKVAYFFTQYFHVHWEARVGGVE